jgi:hypothetical protein
MSPSITNGPFLPSGATHTSRKGYKICELLALLGMHNKDEQVDFKRILRDFMIRTPGSKDGLDRDELASLTEEKVRGCATFFLDKIKISPFNQTAGKTFWPSHTFNPSSEPGPRPKKWTYANNRNGIIDFVTQIMITQQENRRKNDLDKTKQRHRKRKHDECAPSRGGSQQTCLSDTSGDEVDLGEF